MTDYVLDAHALVWMLEGNARLGTSARAVLNDPLSILILPVTALAEACWVVSKGRTSLPDWRDVLKVALADNRIRVVSLDPRINERAMSITQPLEMHDAQIVATALIQADGGHDVRLITFDKTITDSGLLPVIW